MKTSFQTVSNTKEHPLVTKDAILEMYYKEKALIEKLFFGKIQERLLSVLDEKVQRDLENCTSFEV